MRYLATFFWVFLLTNMAGYVVSSMTAVTYDFATTTIVSAVFSALLFFVGDFLIPNEPVAEHH